MCIYTVCYHALPCVCVYPPMRYYALLVCYMRYYAITVYNNKP